MTFWMIIRNSLRQHALSTAVTALSIGLGCGLLMGVLVVSERAQQEFRNVTGGFDALVGPRGSPTQLVLNSLFHIDSSPGLIGKEDYKKLRRKYKRYYEKAVPIAVGDNFKGFRIVGTTLEMFQVEYAPGRRYEVSVGDQFIQNEKEWAKEAVIGDFVARKLGLRLNDEFNPYHGVNFAPGQKPHKDVYRVVGILKHTGTPADRVIWIPIEGLQTMDGHDERFAGDVSAVLLQMSQKTSARGFNANRLDGIYNKDQNSTLTFVKSTEDVVLRLFEEIGWADKALRGVALLVALVAAGSVLASIYNTMNERRREFAILRALGARRGTVFSVIVLESATIAALGALISFAVYAAIMAVAESLFFENYGVTLRPQELHQALAIVPAGIIALGALVGIIPALKAYATDVAENIIPQS